MFTRTEGIAFAAISAFLLIGLAELFRLMYVHGDLLW